MQSVLASNAVAAYLGAALNHLDTGVFLVDGEMHLLHANVAALALLERDTVLRRYGDKLLQDAGCGERSLARMVRAVLADESAEPCPQALCVLRCHRQPLLLTVAPFLPPRGRPVLSPCAIVMVADPESRRLSRDLLRQLFDLTPAEASVAQALARGEALDDIAAELAVTLATVKSHLQRLFRKTGTRRQGELVAMLHRSPAVLPLHPFE